MQVCLTIVEIWSKNFCFGSRTQRSSTRVILSTGHPWIHLSLVSCRGTIFESYLDRIVSPNGKKSPYTGGIILHHLRT